MATILCWWHSRFFPNQPVPTLIIFGADSDGELKAICPNCRAKVVEEVANEKESRPDYDSGGNPVLPT